MWGYATVKWGTLPHVGYVVASLGAVIARLRYAIVSWGPKSLTKKKLAQKMNTTTPVSVKSLVKLVNLTDIGSIESLKGDS